MAPLMMVYPLIADMTRSTILPYVLHEMASGDAHATHLRQTQVDECEVACVFYFIIWQQGDIAC